MTDYKKGLETIYLITLKPLQTMSGMYEALARIKNVAVEILEEEVNGLPSIEEPGDDGPG